MTHCKGEFCPVRDVCTNNRVFNSTLTQTVDWSVEGCGSIDNLGSNFTPYCGPYSNPPYARFQGDDYTIGHADYTHEYGSAFGLTEPQPCSIEIVNCNRITVGLKDFDVDVDLLPDYFVQIDKITINGITFVRSVN
jgi:hypothetical protein